MKASPAPFTWFHPVAASYVMREQQQGWDTDIGPMRASSFMPFYTHVGLCSHHGYQGTELFHHHKDLSHAAVTTPHLFAQALKTSNPSPISII